MPAFQSMIAFHVNSVFSPALIKASLLTVVLILSACGDHDSQKSSGGATTAAEFDIDNYQGKWVLINYWAEWCAPCIKEIPELNKLDAEHAADLDVIAVNFDRVKGEELKQLSARMGIEFESLENDPADILRLSRPNSLPTTYLFNPEGKLAAKLVGPQTSESLLERIQIVSKP